QNAPEGGHRPEDAGSQLRLRQRKLRRKVLRTKGLLGLRAAEHRIPEARTRIMRDSPREGPFSGLSRPEDSEALRQELMRTERGGSFLPKQQPDLPQKKERIIRKS